MYLFQPFRLRFSNWANWIALAFQALASPLIAAFIQSVCVFRSDFRLYQAMIGGAYFHSVENPGLVSTIGVLIYCCIFAIPVFFVLLPFRKRVFYRWLIWMASTAFLTWFFIRTGKSIVIK
jgi:hypothetical protein